MMTTVHTLWQSNTKYTNHFPSCRIWRRWGLVSPGTRWTWRWTLPPGRSWAPFCLSCVPSTRASWRRTRSTRSSGTTRRWRKNLQVHSVILKLTFLPNGLNQVGQMFQNGCVFCVRVFSSWSMCRPRWRRATTLWETPRASWSRGSASCRPWRWSWRACTNRWAATRRLYREKVFPCLLS